MIHKFGPVQRAPLDMLPALVPCDECCAEITLTVAESIFAEPMPNLRKLLIICVNNSKILAVLAREVSNLHEFSFNFQLYFDEEQENEPVPMKASDFTEFLQENKHLSYIYLDFRLSEDIEDFIPHLKECKHLKDVTLAYEKLGEISESCEKKRCLRFTPNQVIISSCE